MPGWASASSYAPPLRVREEERLGADTFRYRRQTAWPGLEGKQDVDDLLAVARLLDIRHVAPAAVG